jgi:hypothetical protein
MTAGAYDFIIEQGSTFTRTITWKDANDSLVDLTSYTARMHLRRSADEPKTLIELTTENGRITLGGSDGTIVLSISASDTASLSPITGVYDLEMVNGANVSKIIAGSFTVKKEVTR